MDEKITKYLQLSDNISLFSKDKSTKVGVVFLSKDEKTPLSFGFNGMPRGVDETKPERHERPEKYLWAEHAERNGIYNIAREVLQGHIMFSTKFPTMEAARAIASTGIKTLVLQDFYPDKTETDVIEKVTQLFQETNVKIHYIINNPQTKIEQKYLNYINVLKNYANLFSPDQDKHATMILNEKTLAPIENAFGVNSPPDNIKHQNFMFDKDEKHLWVQESEKNAIFNAIKNKFHGSTAIVSLCPCIHCSLALVSVGVKKVITRKPNFENEVDKRWEESFKKSIKLFEMANIEFIPHEEIKQQYKNKKNKGTL